MTGKLIILCGISASGKSTYAHNLWKENPENTIVINRDKIRELLYSYTEESIKGYYFHKNINKLEKQVTEYEDTLIHEGLCSNKTVVVDATHLKRSYLERFKYWNVETELKLFDIDLQDAILRDSTRFRKVGETIIKNQFKNYVKLKSDLNNPIDFTPVSKFEHDLEKKDCVIFDIDGTLSEICNRDIYSPKDAINDIPYYSIVKSMNDCSSNVIICTGRSEIFKDVTISWLKNHIEPFTEIKQVYFRDKGDNRPDWIVKEEMWRKINKEYNISLMYEDRNSVVRRARALNLKVAQVKYGNY